MKPAAVRRLYITALCCGLAAALLLTFVPPSIPRYTKEGSGFINFVNEPTTAGRVWGQIQWVLSYLGPARQTHLVHISTVIHRRQSCTV